MVLFAVVGISAAASLRSGTCSDVTFIGVGGTNDFNPSTGPGRDGPGSRDSLIPAALQAQNSQSTEAAAHRAPWSNIAWAAMAVYAVC